MVVVVFHSIESDAVSSGSSGVFCVEISAEFLCRQQPQKSSFIAACHVQFDLNIFFLSLVPLFFYQFRFNFTNCFVVWFIYC